MRRRHFAPTKPENEQRLNEAITVPEVRLISHLGEQVGVVPTRQALAMAKDVGLDLVEVSPSAKPPVCKLMDAGKQKYLRKKRESEQRKRQTRITVKEVKLRPKTDEHDFMTKAMRAKRFLEAGDKVKITIMFRGREMAHPEIARAHLDRMIEVMGELAVVEQVARMEGRNMFVILAPSREVLKAVAAEKAQKLKARAKAKSERRAAAGDNTGEVPALDDEPAEEADAEES
ncbi:MAG: translation initiation factor IF-3 [Myxococcota bacterium]|nr:translation initiation factor IF-3 [Myxococcota bacterium]